MTSDMHVIWWPRKFHLLACKNIAPSAFCFDSNPLNESKFSKSVLVLQFLHWRALFSPRQKWMEVSFLHGANKFPNVVLIIVSAWEDLRIVHLQELHYNFFWAVAAFDDLRQINFSISVGPHNWIIYPFTLLDVDLLRHTKHLYTNKYLISNVDIKV